MAIEPRDCFINKTTDNQLYDVLLSLNEKFYIPQLMSRNCFNDLTLNGQLWQIYSAISGGALWTPKQMPTVFWYDPSDSATITTSGTTVTQALDKSGNGYTLSVTTAGKTGPTIGTRTLNGLNVFEYALTIPNNQILENDSFAYDQATTPLNIAMIVFCDDESVLDQDFLFSGTEVSSPRIYMRRTTDSRLQIQGTSGIVTSANSAPEGQNLLIIAQVNATNSAIRLDGTQLVSGNIGTTPFSSLNIGGNFGEDQGVEGYIAEVVSFADNTQQERIEGYLAWKWGLVANLPAGHPYKNSPPLI